MQQPKNIIITGASSGIGEALALNYAKQGISLGLNGRNTERLSAVAQKCREKGAHVETTLTNVTDQEGMRNWIEGFSNENSLDLIIANAGISGGTGGRLDGEPVTEARKIFDINVTGVFNTVEPALEYFFNNQKHGQIAIVSSMAGFRGWPSSPAYSASKGAVRFYGEALRGALKDKDIFVNVICPGFVKSRITDQNNFPMPFKMSAEKAANIIVRGLSHNKGRICFPFPTYLTGWFISILPDFIAQKILSKAPAKSAMID